MQLYIDYWFWDVWRCTAATFQSIVYNTCEPDISLQENDIFPRRLGIHNAMMAVETEDGDMSEENDADSKLAVKMNDDGFVVDLSHKFIHLTCKTFSGGNDGIRIDYVMTLVEPELEIRRKTMILM